MSSYDLYLLAPEISLAALAAILVLVDLVVRKKTVLPILAVLGLAVPLVFSLMLWFDLSAGDTMQMHGMFNTLVVDKFSLFFKFLLIAAAGVVILSSTDYVKKFERFQAEYYALVLFATTGMMLLASTTELITIYISLELTALPIAALAAFMRNSRSTESGMKFLILSAISSAILLYGMVIVYGFTGTTSLPEIAQQIGGMELSGGTPFGSNAPAVRHSPDDCRLRLQDRQRALPDVGARRVRRLPYTYHGLPLRGKQGSRLRGHPPHLLHRLPS